MTTFIIYGVCFAASLLLSLYTTWKIREISNLYGWTNYPSSDRHIHKYPVPRLGGVAIYLTFGFSLLVMAVVQLFHVSGLEISLMIAAKLLLPATLIFAVGLFDDLFGLSAKAKFAYQIVAGMMLFALGIRVHLVPLDLVSPEVAFLLSWLATIFWVLCISNSFNLIDGLDGLAAGSALFSTLTVCIVSYLVGNQFGALMAIILCGALLGFLRYNFNPATIFLGDCGSLFVGFMLSALALVGAQTKTPTVLAVVVPVVALGLPLTETILSVLRRFLSGRPLFTADREHIHHKLLDRGLTHRQVVLILYGVSASCALLSLFLIYPNRGTVALVGCILFGMLFAGVRHLGYHEFFEIRRMVIRAFQQKQIVINNLAIRKASRQLLDVKRMEEIQATLVDALRSNEFDGFELLIGFDLSHKPTIGSKIKFDGFDGSTLLSWKRNPKTINLQDYSWKLSLDLYTQASGYVGCLNLYRYYQHGSILMDVNLLASELQPSLSKAVEAVLVAKADHLHQHAPRHARNPESRAASSGSCD